MPLHKLLKRTHHFTLSYLELFAIVIWILAVIIILGSLIRKKDLLLSSQMAPSSPVAPRQSDTQKSSTVSRQSTTDITPRQKVFLTKTMQGHVYTIEGDPKAPSDKEYFDSLKLRKDGESLPSQEISFGQQILRGVNAQTQDFWIDFDTHQAVVLQTMLSLKNKSDYAVSALFLIDVKKQSDSSDDQVKLIATIPNSLYTQTHILFFDTTRSFIVLDQFLGEGCGSGGSIQTISLSGQIKDVMGYGYGCVFDEKYPYRFGGVMGNKLVFSQAVRDDQADKNSYTQFTLLNVFLLDPLTGQKEMLISDPAVLKGLDLVDRNDFLFYINGTENGATKIFFQSANADATLPVDRFSYDSVTKEMKKIE